MTRNSLLEFLKVPKMQLLQPFEYHKISKFINLAKISNFYLSIKQLIRPETIMNSLCGKILLNAIVEFCILSQSFDLFKTLWSLVTQIYAMQNGDIPFSRTYFGCATQDNEATFFKFYRLPDFLVQVHYPTRIHHLP